MKDFVSFKYLQLYRNMFTGDARILNATYTTIGSLVLDKLVISIVLSLIFKQFYWLFPYILLVHVVLRLLPYPSYLFWFAHFTGMICAFQIRSADMTLCLLLSSLNLIYNNCAPLQSMRLFNRLRYSIMIALVACAIYLPISVVMVGALQTVIAMPKVLYVSMICQCWVSIVNYVNCLSVPVIEALKSQFLSMKMLVSFVDHNRELRNTLLSQNVLSLIYSRILNDRKSRYELYADSKVYNMLCSSLMQYIQAVYEKPLKSDKVQQAPENGDPMAGTAASTLQDSSQNSLKQSLVKHRVRGALGMMTPVKIQSFEGFPVQKLPLQKHQVKVPKVLQIKAQLQDLVHQDQKTKVTQDNTAKSSHDIVQHDDLSSFSVKQFVWDVIWMKDEQIMKVLSVVINILVSLQVWANREDPQGIIANDLYMIMDILAKLDKHFKQTENSNADNHNTWTSKKQKQKRISTQLAQSIEQLSRIDNPAYKRVNLFEE
ncbi:hypothetical protein MIR68_006714 [Amoeboaphelidium protococcarum]|nr:hypothetical protein MIR68_006714 [Amoeboaphelidium protococcarum]